MLNAIGRWLRKVPQLRKLEKENASLRKQLKVARHERNEAIRRVKSLQGHISRLRERLRESYRDQLDRMFEDLRRSGSER